LSTGEANADPQTTANTEVEIGAEDIGRIMERLGEGAILVDLATRAVLKANEQFYRLSRFTPDDLSSLQLVRLHDLGDLERILQYARRPEESGQILQGMMISGRDGALFAADVRVTSFAGGEGALILLTYHAPAQEKTGGEAENPPSAPPLSLPAFTQRLAAVRERDDLGRVLVEASAALMGTDQVLLIGQRGTPPGTEMIASAGIPPEPLASAGKWLGQMLASGVLSIDRPRVIDSLGKEDRLAAKNGELTGAGTRAFVVFPLESDGRILGAWVLGFTDVAAARACDLELGRTLAAHLSGTVAGILLLERTRQEKSHHQVLNRIISWLRGPLDLNEILHSLTVELCKTLEADRCVVMVTDEQGGEAGANLRVEAEHHADGLQPLKPKGSIPFASTSLGTAVLYSKEPLAVEDLQVRADLTEEGEESVRKLDLRGFIIAKIVSRQEFIGVVAVGRASSPSLWTPEEVELVGAVADHAAVTMATGRLVQASQERAVQIERERREWERTFDAIPDMLSVHDGYGRMLRANLAMQVRLGGDPRRFTGKECGEILKVVMGRSSGCPHEEAQQARRAIIREIQGEFGVFSLTAIPCFDAAGKSLYIIHVCKEITEEKQIREQLLQTEKMAAVGNLVSGVAHELNNPLAGVVGFSEILLEKEEEGKRKKTIQRIRDEGERASRIVRNLLTFARKHKPESNMVDINSVLEKTIELRAYDLRVNKIKVKNELSKELPKTLADPNQLLQVFMNIITNAEQAMREAHGKGTLTLRTSVAGEAIRITWEDDGPGITPDNLKKIFDPFFTTKAVGKGTGLGLSICHGIIKEHGGTITANSTVGQGTVFSIELPIATGPEIVAQVRRSAAPKARPATILVVDDELAIREMIRDALEQHKHVVDVVESGQAALDAIKKKTYDVILSDMKMPEMDGQELFSRISSDHPELVPRIIFTSGDTVSVETRSFFERSGRPYILKPFKITDLTDSVERLIPQDDGKNNSKTRAKAS
jgi:signal transduction histidine kinase/ActR/RegA family two-component response regulator